MEDTLQILEVCDAALDSLAAPLEPNVLHLWQKPLIESEDAISACYELLLPEEREKASRYRVERPRQDFILTRGTLRSLLSKYLQRDTREITLDYTEYGKPLVRDSSLHFNVSHTNGLAVLAFVLNREIGVDVEKIRPQSDAKKLAERFFSDYERRALRDLTEDNLNAAFFRCWTRKEAYIKAVGEGLSMPLSQFDVSLEPNPDQALLATRPDPNEVTHWLVRNISVTAGYAAALAIGPQTNE
jgi:4'-phosphopantetheinyl transferase